MQNKMDFLDLTKSRYSVRKFTNKPVEEEKIDLILKAAMTAPTACNNQPQVIYCLKSADAVAKLQECKYSHFNETLAFIVCYDKNKCWVRNCDSKLSGEVDATIVATHMMLEAQNLGIGSTWVMSYKVEELRRTFNLSDNLVDVCILVMGYSDETSVPNERHNQRINYSEYTKEL